MCGGNTAGTQQGGAEMHRQVPMVQGENYRVSVGLRWSTEAKKVVAR
jgi:hypothetical protein